MFFYERGIIMNEILLRIAFFFILIFFAFMALFFPLAVAKVMVRACGNVRERLERRGYVV